MFLKRLELFGFKSFAERLDLSFSNGITAIVGPNGSGKSNVSDAVRWVLGEQSAKQLRGANMADVIFKGTEKRKPLSYCEVSLVFDNTDHGLDLEYSEVVITRRLYRSGESEYYINRGACRLKDIVTLFQDTGIGKEGYSIVGQGRIENILSGKQEERRSVFEEAAGIVKYKSRKIESERKLEHTSENLVRINDIIDTLQDRIEPLAQQAETAKEYLTLHEQLRGIEVNFFLIQNELAEQRRTGYQTQLDGIDQEREEKQAFVDSLSEQNEKLDRQLAEQEEKLAGIRAELLELTAGKENLGGQKRVLDERIQNLREQAERLKTELESNEARKKSMEDAINGDKNAEEEKVRLIASRKSEIERMESDLASEDRALTAESEVLEKEKTEVIANINRLSDVKSAISRNEAMKTSIGDRMNKIDTAVEQIRLQRTGIEDALNDQKEDTEEFDREKERLDALKQQKSEEWKKLFVERDEAEEKLAAGEREISAAQSRLRVLEDLKRDFEGFNFSVKRILSQGERDLAFKSHICGVLAQLISVDAKFETAIEAALGASMQDIVTPTEEDAKALIEFLRRSDAGRATFLPVSAIRGRELDAREKSSLRRGGCYGVAAELVRYDSQYGEIIRNLLGRTVITEDLEAAISIARQNGHGFKIVTLKGDVINAGGSMSGGSQRQKTSSLLGREREIEDLKKTISERTEELKRIRDRVLHFDENCKECEEAVKDVEGKLHALEVRFAHDFEKLNSLRNDLSANKAAEEELLTEKEQLTDTLAEIERELTEITQTQGSVESSNTDAQAKINQRQKEFNLRQLEREKKAQKLTDARIECAGLEKELDAMHSNAERMGELIRGLDSAKLKIVGDAKNCETALSEALAEREQSLSKEDDMAADLAKATEREKAETAVRDDLMSQSRENGEKRHRFEQEIFDAGERRHKIEMALAKVDNDLSYLENRIWEEYELTLETAGEFRDPDFKLTGAQTEINRLKKAIAALGNVNVNAIDEYVETKERFDDLTKQRDDLQKAKDDLIKVIEELTKKMDKQFSEQFEIINRYFNKTFNELFGGGRAELKLMGGENSLESDIEIVAQPPGKSLQMLSLLSGGEKALTAIAILFAMLKLKPTPFCILDEIEAALDEANVGNFAAYLRKFAEQTQFIVITHRKPTMEEADSLYGVAMEEKGVSRIVSVKLT